MPWAAKKPCAWPMCPELVQRDVRHCPKHAEAEKARRRELDRRRRQPRKGAS